MGEKKCACKGGVTIIYSCSGTSNLGQACNELAQRLTEQGKGRMGCLAGVGGHVPNMILSAQSADKVIVLDGCQVACAAKIMEHVGVVPNEHIVATDLGLQKQIGKRWTEEEVEAIDKALKLMRKTRTDLVRIE